MILETVFNDVRIWPQPVGTIGNHNRSGEIDSSLRQPRLTEPLSETTRDPIAISISKPKKRVKRAVKIFIKLCFYYKVISSQNDGVIFDHIT